MAKSGSYTYISTCINNLVAIAIYIHGTSEWMQFYVWLLKTHMHAAGYGYICMNVCLANPFNSISSMCMMYQNSYSYSYDLYIRKC